MSIDINTLPYNKYMANLMFKAKEVELRKVADKYKLSLQNLTSIIDKKLSESGAKVGACNTAVDFLITETLDKDKMYKSVEVAIGENILASAIYYANGIGKSEYV